MATVIMSGAAGASVAENIGESALTRVLDILPSALSLEISGAIAAERRKGASCAVEEIRLRADRRVYLTVGAMGKKKNLPLSFLLPRDELTLIFERMCGGSLYAFGESIRRGFISLSGGVRVGICGRASLEGGRIRGIYDISSLNVRLPCGVYRLECRLCETIEKSLRDGLGVLIYSPPAEGKTTLLRSLCAYLSSKDRAMRVSVIDSRDELGTFPHSSERSVDIMSGYPKPEAIFMATAFMNPEVIICDEIGTLEESRAILETQSSGVPLVASAHGDSLEGVLRRPQIRALQDAAVFGLYVGIRISESGFDYVLHTREDAKRMIGA